jgi:hypothetical protein
MQAVQSGVNKRIRLGIKTSAYPSRLPHHPGDHIPCDYPGFDYHPICPFRQELAKI